MSDAYDEATTPADARLLAELGQALGPDDPPPGLDDRAAGLVAFADIDRQLAELLTEPAAEAVGMRGSAAADTALVFGLADGSTTVEVVVERDRLTGQVLAGDVTDVDLDTVSGTTGTATVDDLGRFTFAQPGTGPARLTLRGGSPLPVTTDWFLL